MHNLGYSIDTNIIYIIFIYRNKGKEKGSKSERKDIIQTYNLFIFFTLAYNLLSVESMRK